VRIFHIGNHFFKNQISNIKLDEHQEHGDMDSSFEKNSNFSDDSKNESDYGDISLDYLPNELLYTTRFYNEEADQILNGENN
jgi:hypothetical protein